MSASLALTTTLDEAPVVTANFASCATGQSLVPIIFRFSADVVAALKVVVNAVAALGRSHCLLKPLRHLYATEAKPQLENNQARVIYTIGPSPLDVNRIWIGTDDAVIKTTADGGKTWSDVTPPQLGAYWKVTSRMPVPPASGTWN